MKKSIGLYLSICNAVAALHQGAPGQMTSLKSLRSGCRRGWASAQAEDAGLYWMTTDWRAVDLQWPAVTCLYWRPGSATAVNAHHPVSVECSIHYAHARR